MCAIVAYPVGNDADWFPESFGRWPFYTFLIAISYQVVAEYLSRADYKDRLGVLTAGMAVIDAELDGLVSVHKNKVVGLFPELYKVSTNAIVGLANTKFVQAQIFLVHEHGGHKHLISVYAARGKEFRSANSFPSIGTATDRAVWEVAERGETRFYRNLAWHRTAKMPNGFKRFQKGKRYTTFITTPIMCRDQLIGLLTINSKVPFSLSEDDVSIVEAVARKISIGASTSSQLQKSGNYATITNNRAKGCTL